MEILEKDKLEMSGCYNTELNPLCCKESADQKRLNLMLGYY